MTRSSSRRPLGLVELVAVSFLTEDRRVLRETVVEGIAKSRVEVETAREGDEVGLLLRDTPMSDISIGMIVVGLR